MQIVLVEVGDRLGVVQRQLLLWDVIDPGANDLTDELPAGLSTHGLGYDSNRILRFDEAERHRGSLALEDLLGEQTLGASVDSTFDVPFRPPLSQAKRGPRAVVNLLI
jgi:hypothetical protein